MKTIIIFFLLSVSAVLFPITGIYYSVNSYDSYLYGDNSQDKLNMAYLKDKFNIFFTLYDHNSLEANFSLYFYDKMKFDSEDLEVSKITSFSLEIAKLFSTANTRHASSGKLFIDAALGGYVTFSPFMPEDEKLGFEYGLYSMIKLRLNMFKNILPIKSFDIGIKYKIPLSDNYYNFTDRSLLNLTKGIFFGFSM